MRELNLDANRIEAAIDGLERSALFEYLPREHLAEVVRKCRLLVFEPGDVIMTQGEPSLSFFVLLKGAAVVHASPPGEGPTIELAELTAFDSVGEMGLLLDQPRSATVVASTETEALEFSSDAFTALFLTMPNFGRALCQGLARRLDRTQRRLPMAEVDEQTTPDSAVLDELPVDIMARHRVVPLSADGREIRIGFVDDPEPEVLEALYRMLPGREIKTARIGRETFERILKSLSGTGEWGQEPPDETDMGPGATPPSKLDALLRRMVAEGGTDLHLPAGQRPHWRVDGELRELVDTAPLGDQEVYDLLGPLMSQTQRERFEERFDEDFGYSIPGLARFRVNIFRDIHGVSAAIRPIPARIPTLEQLGVPWSARTLLERHSGLLLVTGPAGSGKSTTVAAMVAHITDTRPVHVVTIEDPVEFVITPRQGLVNHREVGPTCTSFAHGFEAALREDPDVIVLGAIPDPETMHKVLEAAHNGLLVLATMVTPSATATVTQILAMFRPEVRLEVQALLADRLNGIVSQTLCRRIGGGRIAAFEVMTVQEPLTTALREGRTRQIATLMSTGAALGNVLMNEALARLVREDKVDPEEALDRTADKNDLAARLGRSSAQRMKEALKATRILSRKP